jgi:hypothetical protein
MHYSWKYASGLREVSCLERVEFRFPLTDTNGYCKLNSELVRIAQFKVHKRDTIELSEMLFAWSLLWT